MARDNTLVEICSGPIRGSDDGAVVKLAREGRSHPVPLIIGTNKHEAALFKWMKSPLMPITPEAINAMFTEIAAEQPNLQLPTEDKISTTYAGLRRKARGMGVARDVGSRMPSVWLAEGHSAAAPVYLYRFDFATPILKLLRIAAAHATELPFVWGNLVTGPKDPTFKLGGLKTGAVVSERIRARWLNFATHAKPAGLPGERSGRRTRNPTAPACSSTGRTPSPGTSTRISAPPGAPRYSISGSPNGHR
jgi:para-nitrobenzyl esterase